MRRVCEIYKVCFKTVFAQAAAYRANFILSMLITLISNILFPLITILIYQKGASFPEWSFWEVILIQAIYTIASGLAASLFSGVTWATMGHIKEGSYEIILLKPLSPLLFLAATNIQLEGVGVIIGGMVMMAISLANLGGVGIGQWCQFILLFVTGVGVLIGLFLIMAAISFKWVGNSRIPEIFESVKTFGKYPLSIFPKAVQGIVTFLIPVGMVGFFPASALLGRLDLKAFWAMIPCVLFMLFGIWIYKKMIALYEGVGG